MDSDTQVRVRIDVTEWQKIKKACFANTHIDAETTALQAAFRLGQQNVLEALRDGIVIEKA